MTVKPGYKQTEVGVIPRGLEGQHPRSFTALSITSSFKSGAPSAPISVHQHVSRLKYPYSRVEFSSTTSRIEEAYRALRLHKAPTLSANTARPEILCIYARRRHLVRLASSIPEGLYGPAT